MHATKLAQPVEATHWQSFSGEFSTMNPPTTSGYEQTYVLASLLTRLPTRLSATLALVHRSDPCHRNLSTLHEQIFR